MDRLVRQLRSLFHDNRVARAFIRSVFQKDRFRTQWRRRTLFRQLRGRDPALTETECREFFRNVLPKFRVNGTALCHFPKQHQTITFHAETHRLIRRVMRPGRPSASSSGPFAMIGWQYPSKPPSRTAR
jgi:hypothetical protein